YRAVEAVDRQLLGMAGEIVGGGEDELVLGLAFAPPFIAHGRGERQLPGVGSEVAVQPHPAAAGLERVGIGLRNGLGAGRQCVSRAWQLSAATGTVALLAQEKLAVELREAGVPLRIGGVGPRGRRRTARP